MAGEGRKGSMTQHHGRSGSIAAVSSRVRCVMPWLVILGAVVALTVPAEGSVEVRTATGIRADGCDALEVELRTGGVLRVDAARR